MSDQNHVETPATAAPAEGDQVNASPTKATQTKAKATKGPKAKNGQNDGNAAKKGDFISDFDAKFLIECLKHTTSTISVDAEAVATALSYANQRSINNRLLMIKKKYGLAFSTTSKVASTTNGASSSTGSDTPVAAGPIAPTKVRKARAPAKPKAATGPGAKKKAASATKGKKAAKTEEDSGDEIHSKNLKDEEEDDMDADHAGNQDLAPEAKPYIDAIEGSDTRKYPNLMSEEV